MLFHKENFKVFFFFFFLSVFGNRTRLRTKGQDAIEFYCLRWFEKNYNNNEYSIKVMEKCHISIARGTAKGKQQLNR